MSYCLGAVKCQNVLVLQCQNVFVLQCQNILVLKCQNVLVLNCQNVLVLSFSEHVFFLPNTSSFLPNISSLFFQIRLLFFFQIRLLFFRICLLASILFSDFRAYSICMTCLFCSPVVSNRPQIHIFHAYHHTKKVSKFWSRCTKL